MADNRTKDKWLSVADISEKIGVPPETIRRYIRSHGVHLKIKKVHKRYVIHSESVTVFKQIRELYSDGKTVDEVEQSLVDKGISMTFTVIDDTDKPMTVSVADELQAIKDQQTTFNEMLLKEVREQKEFNKLLFDKLEEQRVYIVEQQAYIDDRLDKRDRLLIESIRSSLEVKKEMAVTKEQQEKKGFFSRLFQK